MPLTCEQCKCETDVLSIGLCAKCYIEHLRALKETKGYRYELKRCRECGEYFENELELEGDNLLCDTCFKRIENHLKGMEKCTECGQSYNIYTNIDKLYKTKYNQVIAGKRVNFICPKCYLKKKTPKKDGIKYDDDKADWSLIPFDALREVLRTFEFGAGKYDRDNWKGMKDWKRRYTNALLRHVIDYAEGNEIDEETGYNHLAHAGFNVLALLWFTIAEEKVQDMKNLVHNCAEKIKEENMEKFRNRFKTNDKYYNCKGKPGGSR